jgi:hypothetical protein
VSFIGFFTEDGVVEIGLWSLIIVSILLLLPISELIKKTLFRENLSVETSKVFQWLFFVAFLFVAFKSFPAWYQNRVYVKMSEIISERNIDTRISIARVNILGENSEFDSGDHLNMVWLSKAAMEDMPFWTSLAVMHPKITTKPIFVGLTYALLSKFGKEGSSYGLRHPYGASATILPGLRLRLFENAKLVIILSEVEILNQFDEKFGADGSKLEFMGGLICANEKQFLLVTQEGCSPYGEATKLEFILRDLKSEWKISNLEEELLFLVPDHYINGPKDITNAIMDQVLAMMKSTVGVVGGEPRYALGFRRVSGTDTIFIQSNREILADSRIEINREIVLSAQNIFEKNGTWLAYFEDTNGDFDLNNDTMIQ